MKSLSSIAKELGVSVATVSYVYNNKWRENRIGADLARQIQKRLEASQAAPSALGSQLRTGKTHTVGIILSDLTKLYYLDVLCGIERELAPSGYFSLLCNSGGKESRCLNLLLSRGVDGIILAPHQPDSIAVQLQEIRNQNLPVVLVDNYLPETNLDFVVSDNRWGAAQAIRYCLDRGCRQIGCFIDPDSPLAAIRDRFKGAQDAVAGLDRQVLRILSSDWEREVAEMVATVERPAIFVASLFYFEQGLQFLARLKLRIPRDLVLIGFDPVPMDALGNLCALLDEPIPFVKQPGLEMGARAARRLLAQLGNVTTEPCRNFLKPYLSFEKREEPEA